jgi:hypothetical protein
VTCYSPSQSKQQHVCMICSCDKWLQSRPCRLGLGLQPSALKPRSETLEAWVVHSSLSGPVHVQEDSVSHPFGTHLDCKRRNVTLTTKEHSKHPYVTLTTEEHAKHLFAIQLTFTRRAWDPSSPTNAPTIGERSPQQVQP